MTGILETDIDTEVFGLRWLRAFAVGFVPPIDHRRKEHALGWTESMLPGQFEKSP
ncbi:MAG: hypothetical protein WBV39_16495 [Rudaea sp.]